VRWIENADAKMDTRVELASVLPSELRIAELRRAAVSEGLPPAEAAAMGEVTVRAFLQKRWPTTHVGLMPAERDDAAAADYDAADAVALALDGARLGLTVARRDGGDPWDFGSVTSLRPLEVSDDVGDAEDAGAWHEVRRLTAQEEGFRSAAMREAERALVERLERESVGGGAALRPMLPADLPAICALEAASYPAAVVEGAAVLGSHLRHHGAGCFVAASLRGGLVLGYAIAAPGRLADCPLELHSAAADAGAVEGAEADDDGAAAAAGGGVSNRFDTLYLHDVAVDSATRGRGIGQLLTEGVEAHGRELRLGTLSLTAVCGAAGHWERRGWERRLWTIVEAPAAAAEDHIHSGDAPGVATVAKPPRSVRVGGAWAEAEKFDLLRRLSSYPEECGEVVMMRKPLQ